MKEERERNPAQLEHARPMPRDEVYLDASSGIRDLAEALDMFPQVPREFFSSAFESSPLHKVEDT